MKRLVFAFVIASLLGFLGTLGYQWMTGGPFYWYVTTKRIPHTTQQDMVVWFDGFISAKRWGENAEQEHGKKVMWRRDTGFLFRVSEYREGDWVADTSWLEDGTVEAQFRRVDPLSGALQYPGEIQVRRSPPWWWGMRNQTEPTAPWFDGNAPARIPQGNEEAEE